MTSLSLCRIVRAAVVAVAICGLVVCGYILPRWGMEAALRRTEDSSYYMPWLVFLWAAAVPCFIIVALVWKVSTAIKNDRVFTFETARLVKTGSVLLFCDVGFFFVGNVVLFILNLSHPGVLLASLFIDVFGVSLALLAAVLARYLTKAAALQEEADGTI